MSYVGVNIGALTVKVVALAGDEKDAKVVPHQGRPLEVLKGLLAAEFADGEYFGVSGQLGHISEVAAIQRALREVTGDFDAVASLGGESFLVYIARRRARSPTSCRTTNAPPAAASSSCSRSAGWGCGMDEAIRRSFGGKVVPLASPLLGPLQVGHHPQAQPQRGHARGHPAHAARQHGRQGRRPAGERRSASCGACW